MQRVDVVYALIHDEETDKILMVHNVEQNVWSLPGGAVEKGEILEGSTNKRSERRDRFNCYVRWTCCDQ